MSSTPTISGKMSFGFYSASMWNLRNFEKILAAPATSPYSEFEICSIYSSMIFYLYVYMEGIINNGITVLHLNEPRNIILRKHISELTKRNLDPFEILKFVDMEFHSNLLLTVKDKYLESFRYHEDLRNLVAHGGVVSTTTTHDSTTFTKISETPNGELNKLIAFLKKQNIYREDPEQTGYITDLATKTIYEYYKNNCKSFILDLVSSKDKNLAMSVLFGIDYEFFGLTHP